MDSAKQAKRGSGTVLGFVIIFLPMVSAGGLFLHSCKRLKTGARETFSRIFSCPDERIDIREREDIPAHTLDVAPPPPADVAADPGRLAIWQTTHSSNAADQDDRFETFEASGCDHRVLLACAHPIGSKGTVGNLVSCTTHSFPDGNAGH